MQKYLFFICTILTTIASATDTFDSIEAVQQQLYTIHQAKIAIIQELKNTLIIGRKAKYIAKQVLDDSYDVLKMNIKNSIDNILYSQEFMDSLEMVVNYQIECICDKNIAFEDITYEQQDILVRKIDLELKTNFTELNDTITTLFNIFYVATINKRGCKCLLNALEKLEKRLNKRLA